MDRRPYAGLSRNWIWYAPMLLSMFFSPGTFSTTTLAVTILSKTMSERPNGISIVPCAPGSSVVISPVGNVRSSMPLARNTTLILIDTSVVSPEFCTVTASDMLFALSTSLTDPGSSWIVPGLSDVPMSVVPCKAPDADVDVVDVTTEPSVAVLVVVSPSIGAPPSRALRIDCIRCGAANSINFGSTNCESSTVALIAFFASTSRLGA